MHHHRGHANSFHLRSTGTSVGYFLRVGRPEDTDLAEQPLQKQVLKLREVFKSGIVVEILESREDHSDIYISKPMLKTCANDHASGTCFEESFQLSNCPAMSQGQRRFNHTPIS